MAIQIDCKSIEYAVKCDQLHHMPCRIDTDSSAKVEKYFLCNLRTSSEGDCLESSFRGRPLLGEKREVPEGYVGVVLKETHKVFNEEEDRKFKVIERFDDYTHWNLDLQPSINDKIALATQWLDIAKVMHDPVDDIKENGTP